MNIAIIGTGNVGGALAQNWASKGHRIYLGVRDPHNFKGKELLGIPGITAHLGPEAVAEASVVLIALPAHLAAEVAAGLGDLGGKVLIDATNAVVRKPAGFPHAFAALQDLAPGAQLVKCFNTTGYENLRYPLYQGEGIDMFMAGDSTAAKAVAKQLALDAGFAECWDFGMGDKVALLEQFALSWINLAIMQGHGRGIAFKVLKR